MGELALFLWEKKLTILWVTMNKIDPKLKEQLKILINSLGYELVGAELLPRGRKKLLRLYIDSTKGVTVDDCSQVSYQVSAMLDVSDPIPGSYTLEVSSPGIDRPLFELEQYKKYIGKKVKIKLRLLINQRRQYTGILQRVDEGNIHLVVEGFEQEVIVPFSEIEKANLIGDLY